MKKVWKNGIWKKVVLFGTAIFLFYSALKNYCFFGEDKTAVGALYGTCPDQKQAGEIQKSCETSETVTDVCFICNEGIKTVQNPGYSRQTKAQVVGLLGKGYLYDKAVQSLDEKDTQGCILDRNTALDLFGKKNCIGNQLVIEGKTYQVRNVMEQNQQIILIRSIGLEKLYTQVLVGVSGRETKESALSRFLISYGLTGSLIDDDWLKVTIWCFLVLFLLAMGMGIQKESGLVLDKNRNACIRLLLAACILAFLIRYLPVSYDWLPDKWSDFSFWTSRIKKEGELFRWYQMFPKTAKQAERLVNGIWCMGKCIAGIWLLERV